MTNQQSNILHKEPLEGQLRIKKGAEIRKKEKMVVILFR